MDALGDRAEWVSRWQAAAPRLAAIRLEELRRFDVAAFIESMDDVFAASRASAPTSALPGLIIQQRIFARLQA